MAKVPIQLKGVLGFATPYLQGGSVKVTLPRKARVRLNLKKDKSLSDANLVFVDTDRGILLATLDETAFVGSITASESDEDE